MKIMNTRQVALNDIMRELRSYRSKAQDVEMQVRAIMKRVQCEGDRALFDMTRQFDGVDLVSLKVSPMEIKAAYDVIPPQLFCALKRAKRNIEKFHRSTMRHREPVVETQPGVKVWREFRPIERVGLYVPGGTAAYPSTVLMLGIPAQIAGCTAIMCVPAPKTGTLSPAVLVAADLCGIRQIFKVGGAQAVAAMAYGTESIPKVSKIFGPGNQYVTTAKMLTYGTVAIDMPAGPSEIAILADAAVKPTWVAADLLSQLEHGVDSQALLVTFSARYAQDVIAAMTEQTARLERKDIIRESLKRSAAVVVRSRVEACALINTYAPEHLEIVTRDSTALARRIKNAGSIFLGPYTTEPLGDYATGANHTLPTSAFATMFSPLSTESFGKMIQFQKVSRKGIRNLRNTVETLASSEGLSAHKNAVTIRFT